MDSTVQWTSSKKILFRFSFIFFGLYILIKNNGAFPLWNVVMKYPNQWLQRFIPWVAETFLNLAEPITVFSGGSGDTTYDYVIVLCIFLISLVGMIVWTFMDGKRDSYDQLYAWLLIALRFYVGLMLINYGLFKIFKLQFPVPGPYRLFQNYGDSSPMGLAWTFLGFSKGYNYFMGFAELCGILLLFRRTVVIGALITFATSLNIMAINYFFDVPVKLLSTSLAVMSAILLLHYGKKIITFFLSSKSVSLPNFPSPLIEKRPLRISLISMKYLIIFYACIWKGYEAYGMMNRWGDGAPKDKFYGVYNSSELTINGGTVPLIKGDSSQWDLFFVQWSGSANVKLMNGERRRFTFRTDTDSTISFIDRSDSATLDFTYQLSEKHLTLFKIEPGDTTILKMDRVELDSMELTGRGFRWISEYPYNR